MHPAFDKPAVEMSTNPNLLFLDTETTGLIDFKAPLEAAHQPRICQLACVLTDENGNKIEEMNCLVKPDGWVLSEELTKIHGITNERCHDEGKPISEVMEQYQSMKEKTGSRLAYNIPFDARMLKREEILLDKVVSNDHLYKICVMQLAKPICKVAPTDKMMATGRKTFKTPNLMEAYRFFFDKDFERAHDAMNDVIATMAVYFKIKELQRSPQEDIFAGAVA